MSRYLILGTNLLVLLLVGSANTDYISKHKNTNSYDIEDFELLGRLVSNFAGIVVSQAVLAETSSLMRQFREPGRSRISEVFKRIVKNSIERPIKSTQAVERSEFLLV